MSGLHFLQCFALGGAELERAPARLQGIEYAVGRCGQLVQAQARGVRNRVGQRGQEARERTLARLLGTKRAIGIGRFDDVGFNRR